MNEDIKPGFFPIGSPESRAAARLMLTNHINRRKRIQIISDICRSHQDNSVPHATPWAKTVDGGLMRLVYVPTGMSEDEWRPLVDEK
jgi:hypothetical protein